MNYPFFRLVALSFSLTLHLSAYCQPAEKLTTRKQYIEKYSEEAINQMVEYKIPASITLAQGILESRNGNSELARYGNNHFGIKCHKWEGAEIYQDDDLKNECFRKYASALESFIDHSIFLSTRSRYASLFNLKLSDYKGWAKGLKKAGYATNPKYADILIALIENHKLYQYDKSSYIAQKIPLKKELSANKLQLSSPNTHSIKIHPNNIKYIITKKGDTFYSLASELEMGMWQIYKYNNLEKGDVLKINDIIFLQPKRNKSKKTHFHVFKKGETIKSISQKYGVKLKRILKINNLNANDNITEGRKIYLKKCIK